MAPERRRAGWRHLAIAFAFGTAGLAACGPLADDEATPCPDGVRASDVVAYFDAASPLFGADYQRAHPLGDARTLWTFQDADVVDAAGEHHFAHSAGVLQDGDCWTLLNPARDGTPYLFVDETEPKQRWYWPLAGELSADGATYGLFVAELVERSGDYLDDVEPVGVHLVTLDAATGRALDAAPAPAGGPEIYGWSVTSDADWTYLYSWCLRQWGWSETGHDPECTADVRVGRVPRGELTATPEFWDGTAWQGDAGAAVSVFDEADGIDGIDVVRPTQVRFDNGTFVAVTKPGDWFGDTVLVDRSAQPTGPWERVAEQVVEPKCDPEECNTYFVSFAPDQPDGAYSLLISNNRWDSSGTADPVVYRPSALVIDAG